MTQIRNKVGDLLVSYFILQPRSEAEYFLYIHYCEGAELRETLRITWFWLRLYEE